MIIQERPDDKPTTKNSKRFNRVKLLIFGVIFSCVIYNLTITSKYQNLKLDLSKLFFEQNLTNSRIDFINTALQHKISELTTSLNYINNQIKTFNNEINEDILDVKTKQKLTHEKINSLAEKIGYSNHRGRGDALTTKCGGNRKNFLTLILFKCLVALIFSLYLQKKLIIILGYGIPG